MWARASLRVDDLLAKPAPAYLDTAQKAAMLAAFPIRDI
jgi:hypothetical protein